MLSKHTYKQASSWASVKLGTSRANNNTISISQRIDFDPFLLWPPAGHVHPFSLLPDGVLEVRGEEREGGLRAVSGHLCQSWV